MFLKIKRQKTLNKSLLLLFLSCCIVAIFSLLPQPANATSEINQPISFQGRHADNGLPVIDESSYKIDFLVVRITVTFINEKSYLLDRVASKLEGGGS